MRKVEILAPVGNIDMLTAAISAGANAVYLSGKNFGARAFANNFTNEELASAIKLCHLYGVLAYVTINTVIFENEIDDVVKYIDYLYENDVDAIIIQDLGLSSIVRHRFPNLAMHASTQINAQTLEDCKVLSKLGFSRVILGREVSIDTIKEIKEGLEKENIDLEIEAFVHGAICISYSGGCFYSKLIGGRSGNRGKCAQPCRLKHSFMGKTKYYISPKDLMTIDKLDQITDYVDSLKIEGRMKSKEYVYYTVLSYKNAVYRNTHINDNLTSDSHNSISNINNINNINNMKIAFNRGFTKGFINNERNENITDVNSSNHKGVYIGSIYMCNKNDNVVSIKLSSDLKINDSIRINGINYRGELTEDAIIVNQMYVKGNLVKEAKANSVVSLRLHKKMNVNDKVYLTKREEEFSLPKIDISGKAYINSKTFDFILDVTDGLNRVIKKTKYELTDKDFNERIKNQLSKTGSTPFKFSNLVVEINNCYVPIKELNELRRLALDELQGLREKKNFKRKINKDKLDIHINSTTSEFKKYSISVSDSNQLENIALINGLSLDELKEKYDIYYRYDNLNSIKYLPRVTDEINYKSVGTNIGSLKSISSVYANVTNSYTVRLLESLGINKIGLSIELSRENIVDLVKSYKSRFGCTPNLEVMVYGYYQMLYMKHCFINKECGYKNLHCNKCKDKLYFDNEYRVFGDEKCHLAILYKEPVNLTKEIDFLEKIGIKYFLYDYTIESKDDIISIEDYKEIIDKYYGCYK